MCNKNKSTPSYNYVALLTMSYLLLMHPLSSSCATTPHKSATVPITSNINLIADPKNLIRDLYLMTRLFTSPPNDTADKERKYVVDTEMQEHPVQLYVNIKAFENGYTLPGGITKEQISRRASTIAGDNSSLSATADIVEQSATATLAQDSDEKQSQELTYKPLCSYQQALFYEKPSDFEPSSGLALVVDLRGNEYHTNAKRYAKKARLARRTIGIMLTTSCISGIILALGATSKIVMAPHVVYILSAATAAQVCSFLIAACYARHCSQKSSEALIMLRNDTWRNAPKIIPTNALEEIINTRKSLYCNGINLNQLPIQKLEELIILIQGTEEIRKADKRTDLIRISGNKSIINDIIYILLQHNDNPDKSLSNVPIS